MNKSGRFFGQRLLLLALITTLWGCSERGFITPPTQDFGASLNSRSSDGNPNLSYQGNYLIFDSSRQSQQGIYLYDLQQQKLVNLPGLNQAESFQSQPDLSADGRYIVYVSEEEGKTDIFLYDRQTFTRQNLTANQLGEVRSPTISGNGRIIAFEMNRSGQWDLMIYDQGAMVESSFPEAPNN